jgi:carbamoyltransferase
MNHHLAHAASVYYSSGFNKAAVLVVDGRGSENETQSLFVADENGIECVASTKKIGIGLLYAAVTQAVGFKLLQEGKTMGLAPFGANVKEPVFQFKRHFDGIITDYSDSCVEGSYAMNVSHRPLSTFEDKARAAYDVQLECEKAMDHLARWAKETTGLDYLCISGGVALNSVTNYKILKSGLLNLLTGVGRQIITKLDAEIQVGLLLKVKNFAFAKFDFLKVPVLSIFLFKLLTRELEIS